MGNRKKQNGTLTKNFKNFIVCSPHFNVQTKPHLCNIKPNENFSQRRVECPTFIINKCVLEA
jgi:hypothetical protein